MITYVTEPKLIKKRSQDTFFCILFGPDADDLAEKLKIKKGFKLKDNMWMISKTTYKKALKHGSEIKNTEDAEHPENTTE